MNDISIALIGLVISGKKDLLGECVVDMLDHGTYDKKKVMIISGLGKNLKEYSPKAYSWDKLSKLGPCMVILIYTNIQVRAKEKNISKPFLFPTFLLIGKSTRIATQ